MRIMPKYLLLIEYLFLMKIGRFEARERVVISTKLMFQRYYGPIEKNVIYQLYHYLAVQCKAEPLIWANVCFDQNINTQNDLVLLCDLLPWQPGHMPSFDLSILLIKIASCNPGITFNCSEHEDNIIGVQMSRIWGYFMHTSGPCVSYVSLTCTECLFSFLFPWTFLLAQNIPLLPYYFSNLFITLDNRMQ